MKEYYRELKTFEEFLETVPEKISKDKVMMRNTKYLFTKLKQMKKKGKGGKFFLIKFFCPFCKNYETIHQIVFEMKGIIKEKFDKDEPITMMCPKCNERTMFLFASGITDQEIVKAVLEDMGKEERMGRFGA